MPRLLFNISGLKSSSCLSLRCERRLQERTLSTEPSSPLLRTSHLVVKLVQSVQTERMKISSGWTVEKTTWLWIRLGSQSQKKTKERVRNRVLPKAVQPSQNAIGIPSVLPKSLKAYLLFPLPSEKNCATKQLVWAFITATKYQRQWTYQEERFVSL